LSLICGQEGDPVRLALIAFVGILVCSGYLMFPSMQELARRLTREDAGGQLLTGAAIGDATMWDEALNRHAPVDVRSPTGWTPLMLATMRGDLVLAQRLMDGGADIEARSDEGITPLWSAALGGHDELVSLLIEAGAAVDQPAFAGGTALHAAASQSQTTTAKLLLAHGADANRRNCRGSTPLIILAYCGSADAILAADLIFAGADIEATDQDGMTPQKIAAAECHVDLQQLLLVETMRRRIAE
jgi:uncharacterized protein